MAAPLPSPPPAGPTADSRTRWATVATPDAPLALSAGGHLTHAVLAYKTWGRLNDARTNAILVFHALSGSHHAAGLDREGPGVPFWNEECHRGWWDDFIGPGRAFDTDRFFVVCANYLGSCYGSTGPSTPHPETHAPWGSAFPYPSISDTVDSQVRLLDQLGIERLLAVAGGSMGGFCAIDLAARYPERVGTVIPIASGLRATTLAKTHNFEQIFAIEADPNFRGGDYYDAEPPNRGLALARMISHKTFVSLDVLAERARTEIVQPREAFSCYRMSHQIESYMLHQGMKFVERFDANSYLRIVAAWQSFDLPRDRGGRSAAQALAPCRGQDWLLFSIDSDVCFYPEEQAEIETALQANRIAHQYVTVHSEKGHDAFLIEPALFTPHIVFRLAAAAARVGA